MPEYRRRKLNEVQTTPALDSLRGHQPMRRIRASAIHSTGDRVLTHGRRILASVGLHGASGWHIPDVPGGGVTKIYPTKNVPRIAAHIPSIPLTPGHFVRAVVIANPSGMTEGTSPITGTVPTTGADGKITIVATYNNPLGASATATTVIPGSALPNGAQATGKSAAWGQIYRRFIDLMLPDGFDPNQLDTLASWSNRVTVTLTIYYVGSPRVIDVVVYEAPLALAYNLSAGGWIAPMHATPQGGDAVKLSGGVPLIKASPTDPGGGAEIVVDAARRVCQETGPVLLSVSTWDEGHQAIMSTGVPPALVVEPDYRTIATTSYSELFTGSTAEYANTLAGTSVSSGANARRVQDSEATSVLRDKDNVVPVRCYIYGSMSTIIGLPTATIRFETATYSIAEIPIPSGSTDAWHSASGYLRCGLGAQDPVVVQVRGKVSSATFRWRYIVITYENS